MSEFSVRKVNLITYEGETLNIKNIISEYNIYESLSSSSISAELLVFDNNNLLENYNIFGQEKVIIEIGNSPEELYTLELYLFKISGRTMHQKKQGYILHCCSKEVLINEGKRISKRFKNLKSEEIIKNVLNNYLGIDNKEFVFDPSIYNINVLSPNWRAFDLIAWLQTRTIPSQYKDSAGYYFYETLNKTFNFRSVDNLINKKPIYNIPYTYTQGNTTASKTSTERFRIKRFTLPAPFNILESSRVGLFSHCKMNIDITNRRFYSSFQSMDEFFESAETLNEQKPYRSSGLLDLTKSPTRIVMQPFLADTWSDSDKTLNTDVINNNINKSVFRYNLFNMNKLEIEIKGDFNLRVGSVVEISIPTPRPTTTIVKRDDRLSGKYLVHSIKHTIRRKVDSISYVTLVRDSYGGEAISDSKIATREGYLGVNNV